MNVHFRQYGSSLTRCGERVDPKDDVGAVWRWDEVTCPECLAYRPPPDAEVRGRHLTQAEVEAYTCVPNPMHSSYYICSKKHEGLHHVRSPESFPTLPELIKGARAAMVQKIVSDAELRVALRADILEILKWSNQYTPHTTTESIIEKLTERGLL